MIHDPELLDKLSAFDTQSFQGRVFRATRMNLDPLAYSSRGGRWAPADEVSVLYTSMEPNGALAEISFHLMQLSPRPSKHLMLHTLEVSAQQTLHLVRADLAALDVDMSRFGEIGYTRTREVGAAVSFLGNDGLIVPSARWGCENLVLFEDASLKTILKPVAVEQIDWQVWCQQHGRWELDDTLGES